MRIPLAALSALLALPSAAQDRPALVTGRLVDQAGAPVPGASLEVSSIRGGAGTWKDVAVKSDALGRFSLRFLPEADQWFLFEVQAPGLAVHQDHWRDLVAGEARELGDIELVPAGVVVGRVVDPEGEAVVADWQVTARQERRLLAGRSEVDPETGEFRIEGLPGGRVALQAYSASSLRTESIDVDVQVGTEVFVELLYDGPDPRKRITVRALPKSGGMRPDMRHVHLYDAVGRELAPSDADHPFENAYDDLAPGLYRVVLDDPRYEEFTAEVEPGGHVDVDLVGAATLALEVVDAETGQPLPHFGLQVLYDDSLSGGSLAILLPPASPAPVEGRVTGIVPGTVELIVTVPDRPEVRLRVEDVAAGEATPVRVEVPRSVRFGARVVDAEGRPDAAGVRVEWTPGDTHGHTTGGSMSINGRTIPNVREVIDVPPSGEFTLSNAGPGEHALRVCWSEWLIHDVVVELPRDEPLVIERPPHGFVEGRLLVPAGLDPTQVTVDFHTRSSRDRLRSRHLGRGSSSPSGVEVLGDRYRAGPLPPGRYQVLVGKVTATSFSSRGFRDGEEVAEVRVIAGETTALDVDARSAFPSEATVVVDTAEVPLRGAQVTLFGGDESGSTVVRQPVVRWRARFADLDQGRYAVCVQSDEDGWSADAVAYLATVPGQEVSVSATVPLAARRVRFVDDGGAPIGDERVTWACGRGQASRTTDVAGHLDLTLVQGTVSFGRGDRVTVDVSWAAGEETLVVVLREE